MLYFYRRLDCDTNRSKFGFISSRSLAAVACHHFDFHAYFSAARGVNVMKNANFFNHASISYKGRPYLSITSYRLFRKLSSEIVSSYGYFKLCAIYKYCTSSNISCTDYETLLSRQRRNAYSLLSSSECTDLVFELYEYGV